MNQTADVSTDFEAMSGEVVSSVFLTMLEMDVTAMDSSESDVHFPIVGTIHFLGGWKGVVLMEFEEDLAFTIAAHLMKMNKPTRIDGDVQDAVGELVNMVAGNLKVIMPENTHMSMPSVVQGDDFEVNVLGSEKTCRTYFRAPRGLFSLTLIHMGD
jgi:chemotaxis protein CheX